MSLLIQNATIITMIKEEMPFQGDIFIENEEIVAISRGSYKPIPLHTTLIDATGMIALPGLINTHQHSPMSLFRSYNDDLRLMDWLRQKILPAEARMTEEDIYYGSLLGIAEMIRSGTTTFADMYIHMDQVAAAASLSGIRASLTRGLVFNNDLQSEKRLQEGLELIHHWSGKADGRITTMLGPHAPYTCDPTSLKRVMQYATDLDVAIHIHLAETLEESEWMQHRYKRSSTQYLHQLGMLDGTHHLLLAHCVHVNENEIPLLTKIKGGIAHNPMSNLKLGCGFAPITHFREQHITVALGTDGAGSASSLDLFKEMKIAAGLQKAQASDPLAVSAFDILSMATVNGARVLGLEHQIGKLETGKKADLILINLNQPHLTPQHDLYSLLAYAATGADVDTSIVNGQILMRGRKLQTIDEEGLLQEVQERAQRLVTI
ncbi:amidohydrolase [Mechercharimyces sp. CAU 1602]|uniref:amidohydrolase n=1 Tax=Mechercharimyces sp. CAU 1602 TaxID=2973933 RepID=UPI002163BF49|nr:amidohydrolase [Mechercharimyces sp. CAU 1602]MCS1351456.1 amidohydrolase [Mechercharimyces sp. CAU 1602]